MPRPTKKQLSDAGRALGSSGAASRGGQARARALTPEKRKAIARRAIRTRWEGPDPSDMVRVTFDDLIYTPVFADEARAYVARVSTDVESGTGERWDGVSVLSSRTADFNAPHRLFLTPHAPSWIDEQNVLEVAKAFIASCQAGDRSPVTRLFRVQSEGAWQLTNREDWA